MERGVRQRDPLSPFLFILATKGLNAIVSEAVEKGIFKGIKVGRNNVVVSHLQYADDAIFFGEWNGENAKALMDRWRWTLSEDGEFTMKELTRALKGRLPVREELDKRGIDLDSLLCPCCDNVVESCNHSLVLCDLAMKVWERIFRWWKVGNVNLFSICELFALNGNVNIPSHAYKL
ncbi:RNA-directed DNA polymerase, eukaryota, reverse transcriptase zinc-binding domain protein [Tanacetum coccineum]